MVGFRDVIPTAILIAFRAFAREKAVFEEEVAITELVATAAI